MPRDPSNPIDNASRRLRTLNMLSTLIFVLIAILLVYFLIIFKNPGAAPAMLRVPTQPKLIVIPSQTPVILPTATDTPVFPATWTATPGEIAGIATSEPQTPLPGVTVVPMETATLEPTVSGGYPFQLQGDPAGMKSSIFKSNSTCAWLGVAGKIYDLQGRDVVGMVIRMGGYYNYQKIDPEKVTLSGAAKAYGESGYEITISTVIVQTSQTMWIQLFDQSAIPMSPKIYFDTYADCNRNLILINFKQVR